MFFRKPPSICTACLIATTIALATGCASGEEAHEADSGSLLDAVSPAGGAPHGPGARNLPATSRAPDGLYQNVLLITIDTWRYDAAGFAGSQTAKTPTLDRLAKTGLLFKRAHAHNVLTLPSHANILTGLLPYQHGVRDNAGFFLRSNHVTLAERLKAEGFTSGAVVGAFPLDSSNGLDQGFDSYDDSFPKGDGVSFSMAERNGSDVVDLGLAWWRQHQDRQRFLWLHLYDPHTPYSPTQQALAETGGNAYLGEVADVDRHLARILDPLLDGSDPAASTTLVVVTGDHGESLGEHGEATHGLFAYDATLRVPLLLWGGGLAPELSEEPASHRDIVPTILQSVGLQSPAALTGRSLLSSPQTSPVTTYFEALNGTLLRGWAPLRGVIEADLLADTWTAKKCIDLPVAELYDLDLDPTELANLLPKQKLVADRVCSVLPTESQWPPQAGAVSEEERRALESLGYLSGGGPSNVPTEFTAADDPKNLVTLDDTLHKFIDAYRRGRLEQATELARSMVRLRPQMGLGHYHLAQVLLEAGNKREALRVLSDAYRNGTTTPSLLRQLGLSLAEAGRHQEALRVLEPLVESGDLDTLLAYAQAQAKAGQLEGARETLTDVLKRDDENAQAYEALALVAVQAGNWPLAQEQAQQAINLNENLALPWNYLGIARYNLNQRGPALEAWQRSLRLDPKDFDVLYNYAIVSAEAGRRNEAVRALERFVAEAPADLYAADQRRASELLVSLSR